VEEVEKENQGGLVNPWFTWKMVVRMEVGRQVGVANNYDISSRLILWPEQWEQSPALFTDTCHFAVLFI